jgi:hypothetical protein
MKPGVQTDGRTGDGYDHDDKYGSFSSPQDRKVATLRYQAAALDHYVRNVRHMAEVQSAEIAQALDDWGHDQANDYNLGGPQRRRQTLGDGSQGRPIPDNSWDDDVLGDLPYGHDGRPRTNQGKAATGKAPAQATFSDGTTLKIRRYKRPAHLQSDLDRFEAAVGAPVVKYSPDELAALGLTRSTAPFDLQFLF